MESKNFKLVLRTIIREELEYFFNRMEKRLNEGSVDKVVRSSEQVRTVKTKTQPPQYQNQKPALKSKFMQMISEGFNEDDLENLEQKEPVSILEESVVNKLKNSQSKSLKNVADVLTKDYSGMMKKIEQIKSQK